MNVAEANLIQRRHLVANGRNSFEKIQTLFDGHIQNVGDGFSPELDFQCFAVIAFALAHITFDINIRQKMHFDLDNAVALARFTAPALHVE